MPKHIIVSDSFQQNYKYKLTRLVGKNFNPEFQPQLTPKEMLELGVFGGIYFDASQSELPASWFTHAKLSNYGYDKNLNYFKIKASQNLQQWQKKGWIHPDDPRGWFQWYCRYYLGRRHSDDERQIKRWKAITRHTSQIQKNCFPGDSNCRPRQRQAVMHWAYDSRVL